MTDTKATSLSIGALARATGIPAETLRTWERRYGFPAAERTSAGHRRYPLSTLNRLQLVARALAAGHKASQALLMDEDALREYLRVTGPAEEKAPPDPGHSETGDELDAWFGAIMRFDRQAFDTELRRAWSLRGAHAFVDELASSFLFELGERWHRGSLDVRHEHFASERMALFLASQWDRISAVDPMGQVICAALPGEQHVLGLHLAAVAVALSGRGVVFLGANAPVEEIAGAALELDAQAVLVSASSCIQPAQLSAHMATLMDRIYPAVPIVVGGAGFGAYTGPVTRPGSFAALSHWLSQRPRRAR